MAGDLIPEVWACFGVGIAIIFARFAVRFRTVGWRGLQGDDFFALLTLIFYTLDAVTVHVTYHTGQNVDVTPETLPNLTQDDIARLTYGSKIEVVAWYSYTALIWSMKFTMLFFYRRLTLGSLQNKIVRYLFWVCGAAYLAVFLTITFGCYPFHLNWQVTPIAPEKCSFRLQNLLVTALLNISTDVALLLIPVPMLWRLKIPIHKKLVISLILSSGLFVIAAAVIRVCYTLDANPSGININRWGIRETIIGVTSVSIPVLRPFFTKAFWKWGPYDPAPSLGYTSGSRTWRSKRLGDSIHTGCTKQDVELGDTVIESLSPGHAHSRSSSQQDMVNWDRKDNVVFVQTTYDITSRERGEEGSINDDDNGWNAARASR